MTTSQPSGSAVTVRHPQDPDPVPSTKAAAAFALSIVALMTSPLIGGVIPGVTALVLARQADADIAASDGFLLGARQARRARLLARAALAVAALTVTAWLVWTMFLAVAMPS